MAMGTLQSKESLLYAENAESSSVSDKRHKSRRRRYGANEAVRPQLDDDAASEVREALKLGMPLGSERFAEAICARLGIRRNTGKRGRPPGEERESPMVLTEQQGFGF